MVSASPLAKAEAAERRPLTDLHLVTLQPPHAASTRTAQRASSNVDMSHKTSHMSDVACAMPMRNHNANGMHPPPVRAITIISPGSAETFD